MRHAPRATRHAHQKPEIFEPPRASIVLEDLYLNRPLGGFSAAPASARADWSMRWP